MNKKVLIRSKLLKSAFYVIFFFHWKIINEINFPHLANVNIKEENISYQNDRLYVLDISWHSQCQTAPSHCRK